MKEQELILEDLKNIENEKEILLYLANFDDAFDRLLYAYAQDEEFLFEESTTLNLLNLLNVDLSKTYVRNNRKDESDVKGQLILEELFNMKLVLEELIALFKTNKSYWARKYGYHMTYFWPEEVMERVKNKTRILEETAK